MQKASKIFCEYHPKEPIIRLSTSQSLSKKLYCLDCLMDAEKEERDLLVPISEYLERYDQLVNKLGLKSIISEHQSNILANHVQGHEKKLESLKKHIKDQKEHVSDIF